MKKQVTLRIDEDILDWFRSKGRGYQGMINHALRSHIDCAGAKKEIKMKNGSKIIFSGGFTGKGERHEGHPDAPDPYFKPMPKKGKK